MNDLLAQLTQRVKRQMTFVDHTRSTQRQITLANQVRFQILHQGRHLLRYYDDGLYQSTMKLPMLRLLTLSDELAQAYLQAQKADLMLEASHDVKALKNAISIHLLQKHVVLTENYVHSPMMVKSLALWIQGQLSSAVTQVMTTANTFTKLNREMERTYASMCDYQQHYQKTQSAFVSRSLVTNALVEEANLALLEPLEEFAVANSRVKPKANPLLLTNLPMETPYYTLSDPDLYRTAQVKNMQRLQDVQPAVNDLYLGKKLITIKPIKIHRQLVFKHDRKAKVVKVGKTLAIRGVWIGYGVARFQVGHNRFVTANQKFVRIMNPHQRTKLHFWQKW